MAASAAGPIGRVFISYRREDTAYPAGWLYDRLAHQYGGGQVFKDVDSIELGDDFVQVISRAVGSCDVLLAMIGGQWLTIADEHGRRRLDDPGDFVRLEIEAALTRDVRVIPILVENARMPRADELPHSLVALTHRQALELSPSRFEYDTGRLLKVLGTTLTDVQTVNGRPAKMSGPPAREALGDPADDGVPTAVGTTRSSPVGFPGRRRTPRRLVLIGVAVGALLALYLIVRLVLSNTDAGQDSGALTVEAPWRLVVRGDGSAYGCIVTLVNTDTRETWSTPDPVYKETSFVMSQGGTFRWSARTGCPVFSRRGPGNLGLPATVDGVGTSDAFKPPDVIDVRVKDFHGSQQCALELHDVATGALLDTGTLTAQQEAWRLKPQGRPLVYLVNDTCAVQVAPG
jgi:hypothetical protein